MSNALWYLRRAVPWTALLGCLLVAGILVAITHRWEAVSGLALTLSVALTAAAAGFCFDETAVPVTRVTTRGGHWALLARLVVAVGVTGVGLGAVMAAPETLLAVRSEWVGFVVACSGVAISAALVATRREIARPGSPLASALVLVAPAPLLVEVLLDVRSPYPLEGWTDSQQAAWTAVAALGWAAAALLAAGVRVPGRRHTTIVDSIEAG